MIERIVFLNGKKSHREIEIELGDCHVIKDNENTLEDKFVQKIENENLKSDYFLRESIVKDNLNTGVRSQKIYNQVTHIYDWRKK